MFGLLPDAFLNWFYWAIIVAGITGVLAGWLGKWIPFYGNYVKILQPIGIVLLVLGVWLRGGYDTEMSWRGKMAEQATAIEKAQEQSKIANAKIENDAKERIKVIYKNATIVKQYIDREVVKYDETCKIPDVVVKAHNAAAKNEAIK
jgi:hypothetical protein